MRRTAFALVLLCGCAFGLDIGVNVDPTNVNGGDPSGLQLVQLGASTARIEFKELNASDATLASSFAFYDAYVLQLLKSGVSVLLILDYATLPGRPAAPSGPDWTPYTQAFAARCGQIAQHYAGLIDAYEIWNEEDLPSVGNVDAATYGPLLQAAYQAIKAVSPAAAVIMGGLASGDPSYVAQARSATGGVLYASAVGVHPYGQRPTADWPSPTWGFGVLGNLLAAYYAVEPLPLWITEDGTDDLTVQGQFPSHLFDAIVADTSVPTPLCYWFCWSDAMVNPYGLVDTDGNPKDSYYNYQKWAATHNSTQ